MFPEPRLPQPETRDRILDEAERLFVEYGFEGTSMRMITGAANANLAAVNYHFGSKDALIQAVFRRRLTALNETRLAALDQLEAEAGGGLIKPSRIVEAFFGTALELAADMAHGGNTFMRLLSRTYNEPNAFVRQFLAEEYAEVMDRFLGALFRALPGVPRHEIMWRFHYMLGAMSFAIAGIESVYAMAGMSREAEDPSRLLPRLMSFLLGGLRAPLPDFGASGHD
ncbi:TetR/AcrR family transcriptional regulator [Thauera linaloolentis]|uniref:TetR family transcriptional regulator n=1 Tax=Thauera linaloolentis (strain DSM 12138 / JCM 21573 / CCUG 41526 / CIP 105981 / IAM 15112 / NBRC 102519 / 47Lol) TaxID=1123367 RepID=N6ZBW9_THAL4|nr:TetR/AcrR family transcriptional regulator [Thauera linaloolentis]ENO89689.1 TetR family transcriptional regulator [Thauera linaloolentis 47Lol = DSM 12138]MCM8567169.1 TetR/AcrR family transcriptional regulator [Thauera linaloolentis]